MKNLPKISIGLPAYNGEKFIARAISSVMDQTLSNFDFIISDDNSTDETANTIIDFAKIDSRIKYFHQEENLGFRENYNFVLSEAKTKYFIWIGQDDYWDKTLLSKLYDLMEKGKDTVLAMCNTTNTNNNIFEKYPLQIFTNKENKYETLKKFIQTGNLTYFYGLYLTDNLKKISGYQKSSRPFFKSSDYMTIFRALLNGLMVFTNEYLFFKTDTGNYLTRYEDLKKRKINKKYLKKIYRYLFFPLFFIYDLVTSEKYILISDFSLVEKIKLIMIIFIYYLKRNLEFVKSIAIGVMFLLLGIFRRGT